MGARAPTARGVQGRLRLLALREYPRLAQVAAKTRSLGRESAPNANRRSALYAATTTRTLRSTGSDQRGAMHSQEPLAEGNPVSCSRVTFTALRVTDASIRGPIV